MAGVARWPSEPKQAMAKAAGAVGYEYQIMSGPTVGAAGTFTLAFRQVGNSPQQGSTFAEVKVSYTHDDVTPAVHELVNLDARLGAGETITKTFQVRRDWRYIDVGGIDAYGERTSAEAVLATGDVKKLVGGRADFTLTQMYFSHIPATGDYMASFEVDLTYQLKMPVADIRVLTVTIRVFNSQEHVVQEVKGFYNTPGDRYLFCRVTTPQWAQGITKPAPNRLDVIRTWHPMKRYEVLLEREGQQPVRVEKAFSARNNAVVVAPPPPRDLDLHWASSHGQLGRRG